MNSGKLSLMKSLMSLYLSSMIFLWFGQSIPKVMKNGLTSLRTVFKTHCPILCRRQSASKSETERFTRRRT